MIYLINLLLVPLYYLIIRALFPNKRKSHIVFYAVVGVHAILFRALANPYVYVDTERYAYAFEIIADMKFKELFLSLNRFIEWGHGYLLLNWIISRFTNDPMFLFIVLAIISVGGVVWYYSKNTNIPLTVMLIYLMYPMMYLMGFGVVRQHLAIVFTLWALYFADNLKVSIPLAIAGVLCHTSGLVFFPFYFIRHLGIKKFNSTKLLVVSVIGFLVVSLSVSFVLSFFSRYEGALESEGEQSNIVPFVLISSMVIMFLVTGIIHNIKEVKDAYIIRFMIYGVIISILGMTIPRAGRLTLCFIYCLPVALSLLYKYANKKDKTLCYLYTIWIFVIILLRTSSNRYSNYLFLWENI